MRLHGIGRGRVSAIPFGREAHLVKTFGFARLAIRQSAKISETGKVAVLGEAKYTKRVSGFYFFALGPC